MANPVSGGFVPKLLLFNSRCHPPRHGAFGPVQKSGCGKPGLGGGRLRSYLLEPRFCPTPGTQPSRPSRKAANIRLRNADRATSSGHRSRHKRGGEPMAVPNGRRLKLLSILVSLFVASSDRGRAISAAEDRVGIQDKLRHLSAAH